MTSDSPDNESGVMVVEFWIDKDNDEPEFYTLLFWGDIDRPITTEDNRIIFFEYFEEAIDALKMSTDKSCDEKLIPEEPEYVMDLPGVTDLICNKDFDNTANILNFLNMLFDLVTATGFEIPKNYKKLLFDFADHLTFDKEYGSYLTSNNVQRKELMDGILWCIGAIVVKSTFVRS